MPSEAGAKSVTMKVRMKARVEVLRKALRKMKKRRKAILWPPRRRCPPGSPPMPLPR